MKDFSRLQSRLPKRLFNERPRTEEPVNLFADILGFVPSNGFRWVSGKRGFSGRTTLFLVPNHSDTGRAVRPPDDVYIDFAELHPADEAKTLGFANRFGELGLPSTHFHSGATTSKFGETAGDWGGEIAEVAKGLNLITRGASGKELSSLVDTINWRLLPTKHVESRKCFMPDCPYGSGVRKETTRIGPHLAYQVTKVKRNGSPAFEGRLFPSSLLTTIWLQVSELLLGERRLRRCEICGRLMDVSDAARPNAKRVHQQCSRNERQKRWRSGVAGL
jgi:hypothetical protein